MAKRSNGSTQTPLERLDDPGARWLAWLLVGLALILVWRVVALSLNRTDVFFDEAQYWFWGEALAFGYYSKPPLIGWLLRGVTDVCGETAFCLRVASPVMHFVTGLFVGLAARRLYGPAIGLWSGLAFATLPGVSVSAGIISTDVPLLMFFAIALYAFVVVLEYRSWRAAIVLGLALGLGLNAKYAMAYFVACGVLFLAVTPEHRARLRDPRFGLAILTALVLIGPNLMWNQANGAVTFSHTADNAKWGGDLFKPGKAAEFFGAQFGVFGPVFFGAFLVIVWRALRDGLSVSDRMLLAFSLPVILIVTTQAFISRAHANWAAVAYVAATILVVATMFRDRADRWRRGSLALHVVLMLVVGVATALAGRFVLPGGADPFARVLGWETAMRDIGRTARETPGIVGLLGDDRAVLAELNYYLRNEGLPVRAWVDGGGFRDHYEMVQAYGGRLNGPLLFVHHRPDADHVTTRFADVQILAPAAGARGLGEPRKLYLWRLDGYLGRGSALARR